MHEGVYGTIGGPSYETVTDGRFLLNAGCDCVGMSTAHEAIVAAYCGIKVLSFSIITDKVTLEHDVNELSEIDHNAVLQVATQKAKLAQILVGEFLKKVYDVKILH